MNDEDVFINCPFSADYAEKFNAITFTVIRSGLTPRCAREADDAGENRFDKICRIIKASRFGVHDISKTELDAGSGLPRFNMPLELGLFLGARKFGGRTQSTKRTLVLDREPYRYQQFISDIAGQDIHAHGDETGRLIEEVATWLRDAAQDPRVPGGRAIAEEFAEFTAQVPAICAAQRLHPEELTFLDYRAMATQWILATRGA